MKKSTARDIFSIPNVLSYIRIILVPFIIYFYLNENYLWASVTVAFSGFTDCADGYIARKYNMITDIGKIVDPIADKLTQFAVAFCLAMRFWETIILFALLVIKDATVGLLGLLIVKKAKVVEGAQWYGKFATILFYLCVFILFVFPNIDRLAVSIMIWICVGAMALSFVLYVMHYIKILSSANPEKEMNFYKGKK